jgi:uncharacterized protein YcbK (DUF882 family)
MKKSPIATDDSGLPARRRFLKQMVFGSLCAVTLPEIATAANFIKRPSIHKSIALYHANTGSNLSLTYFEQGQYLPDALDEINLLLRDYHTGDVHPIDPGLVDLLYDLKQLVGFYQPIQVISGYRSPYTNAHLREHSHGVAKHSLHVEGRAIDIRIEGVSTALLRKAAVAMGRGGVGYYPRANFVHLDTGDIRTW